MVFVFNNNTEIKLIQKFKKKISELYIKILSETCNYQSNYHVIIAKISHQKNK